MSLSELIPSERLRPIIEDYLAAGGSRDIAGVNPRSFYKVLEEDGNVTFDFTDRLLLAIGCEHEWHLRLADVYAVAADPLDELDFCVECGHAVEWHLRGDAGVRESDVVWCARCYAQAHLGFPMGPWKRAELLDLYLRYLAGATIAQLVRPLWRAKGYSNAAGALGVVSQAWRRNGWPTRRRGESKSLRRQRTGPILSASRKLSEAEARALHPFHWEQWRSINSLAKEHHERLGLSQSSLCSQLSYTWKVLGLPTHDRIEMTVRASTKHGLARRTVTKSGGRNGNGSKARGYKRWLANERAGGETRNPICTGTTTSGKRCTRRALNGQTVCVSHDPSRQDEHRARLADARSRSRLFDPSRIEPLPPLQRDLRAYFDVAGKSWAELSATTGRSRTWLSRISSTDQQRNIDRQVAADLRAAIADLTAPRLAAAA